MLRAAWRAVQNRSANQDWELVRGLAAKDPQVFELLDDGGYRTIFNSRYRLLGVDIGDPRIAEGLRVSLAAIEAIKQRCEAAGVRYVVVLIPTKQSVFENVAASPVPSFTNILTNEASIRETTHALLEARSVEYFDALEPLRAAIILLPTMTIRTSPGMC